MSVNGAGLTSLQKLKLTDNRLERIQAGAFPSGSSATLRLELAENPLHCDCGLAWLLSWPDTTLARARCQHPPPLQGVLVSSAVPATKNISVWPMARDKEVILAVRLSFYIYIKDNPLFSLLGLLYSLHFDACVSWYFIFRKLSNSGHCRLRFLKDLWCEHIFCFVAYCLFTYIY
jgi:hypothetical protein